MAAVPDHELDSIVGAALKALVESGADRQHIGAFAASFRTEVAQILGRQPQAPAEPDLLGLVRQALTDVLQAGVTLPPAAAAPQQRATKPVYVRVNGQRTAVSIGTTLLADLARREGGLDQARARVREVAMQSPPETMNRSAWVTEALKNLLASSSEPPTASRH